MPYPGGDKKWGTGTDPIPHPTVGLLSVSYLPQGLQGFMALLPPQGLQGFLAVLLQGLQGLHGLQGFAAIDAAAVVPIRLTST